MNLNAVIGFQGRPRATISSKQTSLSTYLPPPSSSTVNMVRSKQQNTKQILMIIIILMIMKMMKMNGQSCESRSGHNWKVSCDHTPRLLHDGHDDIEDDYDDHNDDDHHHQHDDHHQLGVVSRLPMVANGHASLSLCLLSAPPPGSLCPQLIHIFIFVIVVPVIVVIICLLCAIHCHHH